MIVFLTGAGVSVKSGLPTYRGVAGLYSDDSEVEDGLRIEEILSRKIANSKPKLTKKYIDKIHRACLAAQPNDLHKAIAELEKSKNVRIYTQNVDDLHERGGSTDVVHLHGGGAKLEPVVLFGDMLDEEKLNSWYYDCQDAEVLVVIGTSAQFPYISGPIYKRYMDDKITVLLDPDDIHVFGLIVSEHHKDESKFVEVINNLGD